MIGLLTWSVKPYSHDAQKTRKACEFLTCLRNLTKVTSCERLPCLKMTDVPGESLRNFVVGPDLLQNLPLAEDFSRDPWDTRVWRKNCLLYDVPCDAVCAAHAWWPCFLTSELYTARVSLVSQNGWYRCGCPAYFAALVVCTQRFVSTHGYCGPCRPF